VSTNPLRALRRSLRLGQTGGVEDADAFVLVEAGDGKPAVLGAGREHDGMRSDLVVALQAHDMAVGARLERDGALGRGGARVELACLRDGAARELRAADPGREAEVGRDLRIRQDRADGARHGPERSEA